MNIDAQQLGWAAVAVLFAAGALWQWGPTLWSKVSGRDKPDKTFQREFAHWLDLRARCAENDGAVKSLDEAFAKRLDDYCRGPDA